ncbi:hypothetical protein HJC23_010113 [Cyclotella cryptica]|uniref:LysM domain-containing protein n=1 Tax=Cyclotella cryptica TaxID=29204 RepID=A0ABD3Q986_9STRA|eukprot:CCRYP_009096-RA/>CCRYP_009096-RA protein AED:0.17 eAED:0.17 QI:0/-1/0/1/-1/1/1/0/260
MSEGGLLAWKIQKVKRPANGIQSTCNYTDLNRPLPDPPKDQMWIQDGREWKLVPVACAVPADVGTGDLTAAAAESVEGVSSGVAQAVAMSVAVPVVPAYSAATAAGKVSTDSARSIREFTAMEDGVMFHEIQPSDTFQGICLRYKITPTELRRANKMMGTNLQLAPKRLVIPVNGKNASLRNDNGKRGLTKEEQIAKLVWEVSNRFRRQSDNTNSQQQQNRLPSPLEYSEARAYLELNDWDLDRAMENAFDDVGWSSEHA